MTCDVILVDEAAQVDQRLFYEVLVPLMEVGGTATICISTPLGKFNYYSQLTDVRGDDGKRVFNVFIVNGSRLPPWKTRASRARIRAIYGNRVGLFNQEIMGENDGADDNAAFDQQALERLFERPPLQPPYVVAENTVFVSMDPNGGASASRASGSETAVVSFVMSQGRLVITGFETHPTPGPQQPRQILYAHITALRAQPMFRNCRFMFIGEANYGNETQLCSQFLLRRFPFTDVLCEHSHVYGIFTNPGDPERYTLTFSNRLATDGVFMHANLVCVNPFDTQGSRAQRLERTFSEFKRQMHTFRAVRIVPTSLTSRVRVVYSGKVDKDNKRSTQLKDDMCMALLFGHFYALRFFSPLPLVRVRNHMNTLELDTVLSSVAQMNLWNDNENVPDRRKRRKL